MREIAAAVALDAVLGDPRRFHPVAGFGRVAATVERALWRDRRAAGALHAALLVAGPTAGALVLDRRLAGTSRACFRVLALWTALGGRSLAAAGSRLAGAVERGDLAAARALLPSLVGRNPSHLGEREIVRAGVESVAENTTDAVVAPLLWFAALGAPGAVAYRAVNTLDAMVGHRSVRYRRFGWAAARLDDLATWPAAHVAATLAALLAPLVGGRPWRAVRIALRDGGSHPSPNAGRIEATFAGALGVRLGGTNDYGGRLEHRPALGDGPRPTARDLRRAVRLSRATGLAAAALCAAL